MSTKLLTGAFAGTGPSAGIQIGGKFNVALWGTFTATLQLERTFDRGTTWIPCGIDAAGTSAAYTAGLSAVVEEIEDAVLYRWNCTAYTSGTVNYRVSQ